MSWRLYLLRTMDGRKGQELKIAAGTIGSTINGIDVIDATVQSRELQEPERYWRSAFSGGLLATYTSPVGVERPVAAGLLVKPGQQNRKAGTTKLTAYGINYLLQDRIVLADDFGPGDEAAARKSVLTLTGLSYRGIMAGIVRAAITKKAGTLPIVSDYDGEVGTRRRVYEGFNLANNAAWKRIEELTEVINGPDVMFRPEWTSSTEEAIRWRMIAGSDAERALPQAGGVAFDSTAARGNVSSSDISSDASLTVHRSYATGSGQGAGIALAIDQFPVIREWVPLIERVVSETSAEPDKNSASSALLRSRASSLLRADLDQQATMTVNTDPALNPFGTWWCGELADVTLAGWDDVADGTYMLRIIAAKYQLGSDAVTLDFQPDEYGSAPW